MVRRGRGGGGVWMADGEEGGVWMADGEEGGEGGGYLDG